MVPLRDDCTLRVKFDVRLGVARRAVLTAQEDLTVDFTILDVDKVLDEVAGTSTST